MVSKSELAIEWPVYRPRNWGHATNAHALKKPWYGLDTERDAKRGDFVCGWCSGQEEFQFHRIADLPKGTYWIWNLAYDLEGMLRDLDCDEAWAARSDGSSFELMGGRAVYFHGKRFDWNSPDKGRVTLVEASSFFGRVPLKEIGAKEGVKAAEMSLERYRADPEYRAAVDSYCRQDARIVYEAVCSLEAGVNELGVTLGSTPGATARRFMARMGKYPNVIWQTHKAFLRSYCGGRFEITKRGVLFDVNQYDLVSAYPWALSNCPWLTESAYHRQTRRVIDTALYGSYQVSFQFDDYLGIAPRWNEGVRVYSKAENRTWLTRPEVQWLQDHGADVTIHRGVEIYDPNATTLWADIIKGLFATKVQGKGKPLGMGAKIVLNSKYGILIQLVRRAGKWVPMDEAVSPVDWAGRLALEESPKEFESGQYYAPVYASNLTALTRLRVLDAGRAVGAERYIGGHTDSVLCVGKMPLSLSSDLGGWELKDTAARADVCKTGMYAVGDLVRVRGITRDGTPSILWEPRHTRNVRRGIKSADSWDEVSVISPKEVMNNFGVERKRKWEREFSLAIVARQEFIDSEALEYVTRHA